MNFSKEYIEMCKKAIEIQPPQIMIGTKLRGSDPHLFTNSMADFIYCKNNIRVWLPRQDQLQKMINRSKPLAITEELIDNMYEWINTWEKFWLVLVMKEKFNKTWNGEDWVASL